MLTFNEFKARLIMSEVIVCNGIHYFRFYTDERDGEILHVLDASKTPDFSVISDSLTWDYDRLGSTMLMLYNAYCELYYGYNGIPNWEAKQAFLIEELS